MKLDFTDQMLAVIDQALGQVAYSVAAPVINEINRQLQAIKAQQADDLEAMRTRNLPPSP
jgi:hypothetical protein